MGDTHSKAEGEERAREEVEALLAQTKLNDEAKDKIRAIANNTCGDKVSFVRAGLGDSGVTALAEALKDNTCLKELDLWYNRISDEGALALAEVLKHNTTVTKLFLEHNNIGPEGAVALADALKHNTTLTALMLRGNRIGPEGAVALAEMLNHNTTLTTLDLARNSIEDKGILALGEMLKYNTTIEGLDMHNNGTTERAMVNVLKQLQVMDTKANIRLFEDKLKSSTAVARVLATLRIKRPDFNVVFCKWRVKFFRTKDDFSPAARAAYQDQLDLPKLLETGPVPLGTAKVFVCGDCGIGKTTMLESLPDADEGSSYLPRFLSSWFGQPRHDPEQPGAYGVIGYIGRFVSAFSWQPRHDPRQACAHTPGIRAREMKLKQSHSSDDTASLHVYDFGGSRAYHVIHTLMMSDRFAAFVVCVDLSQPEEHVKERANYWLQFICTRLKQGIAAATATAGDDETEDTKPRVVIVGTKRDLARKIGLVEAFWQPTWSAAMVAHLKRTYGSIVDIQDSLISLNCHGRGDVSFNTLRARLVRNWRWMKGQEVLVPRVVDRLATALQSARNEKPAWVIDSLFQFVRTHTPGLDLTSFDMTMFSSALRYFHTRGDLLWYSNTPSLADFVFVDPNWLLHDVLGRALTPDGVQQGSITKKGVLTFTDLETAFDGIADADLVINVLQHMLLCFELPPSNYGQQRFMLPSRVEEEVDLATAWPQAGFWPLYAGRLLVVESKALALPPGFFPHVQTLLHNSFGTTLRVWKDAFFCEHDGVQCLGLLRGDRQVDVWVRAPSGAEHKALPFMTKVLSVLQEEATGIDHVHLVLSTKHLKRHEKYPAAHKLEDLTGKDPDELVTSTHHRESQTPVSDRVGDLLLRAPAQRPPVMPSWQLRDHEWHHPAWRLDDTFDEQLPWSGPSSHGVYSAPLPPNTDLYRWIESQMAPGLTLSRVEMIKSTMMLRAFKAQVERSATRRGDPDPTNTVAADPENPFNKDFGAGDPEKQAMLDRLKTQFAETPDSVNHVNVLIGFHGCDEAVTDDITAAGTANLSNPNDPGFFGAGIYLTPQANYAAGYSTRLLTGNWRAPNADGEHVMLLCAASVGLAYPITRSKDYPSSGENKCKKFWGKKLKNGCDTHYAQVTKRMTYQSTDTPATFDFEEYVVSQEAQVLPFAKVFVKVDKTALAAQL